MSPRTGIRHRAHLSGSRQRQKQNKREPTRAAPSRTDHQSAARSRSPQPKRKHRNRTLKASQHQPKCCSQLSPANRDEGTSSNRKGQVASMIANNTGTHLGTAPHLVQILQQPQTRPNPLDEAQPADLAHMIRQPLPQRHRPHQTHTHRPRRRRRSTQQPTPQNPRLGNPRRGPRQPPTLYPTRQCCNDPLNLGNICPFATRTGSPKPASNHRSARLGIRTITPSPNPSSACTRQNSSTNALRGRTSTKSSTPPSNTSTGSTTAGFSNPSETSHQQKRRPTTINNRNESS